MEQKRDNIPDGAKKKRILVVGAGACGLAAFKACKEENFDVVCYEKSNSFGGLWRFQENPEEGRSSVMKHTIANSSKEMTSFSDFPIPAKFPVFLPHEMMLEYLEMFAERFDLSPICYNTEVIKIIPDKDYIENGRWVVDARNTCNSETSTDTFDGIMVCTGHHSCPNLPSYNGLESFHGQILHSNSYKSSEGFENKNVLVCGAGNSGADIAVELSKVSKKVYLSTRNGAWFYPRTVDRGKPLDIVITRRYRNLIKPSYFMEKKLRRVLNSTLDQRRFGIKPDHKVLRQHPTINEDLRNKLFTGSVILKRDIQEFDESGVLFKDEEHFKSLDAIIFATGYRVQFPFLSEDILMVGKTNKVFLYKDIFPPQLPHMTLGIFGMVQPFGSLIPVFEIQARWFVYLMSGRAKLPMCDAMFEDVRKMEEYRWKNFLQTERHATEALWMSYMDDIASQFGAKPNLLKLMFTDPKLFWTCLKGPCIPSQYRLNGPHSWLFAREYLLNYRQRVYNVLRWHEV